VIITGATGGIGSSVLQRLVTDCKLMCYSLFRGKCGCNGLEVGKYRSRLGSYQFERALPSGEEV
jgi:hypothetical protein